MTTYPCNETVVDQHIKCLFGNYADNDALFERVIIYTLLMYRLFDLYIFTATWLISASCGCCLTAKISSHCSAYVICIGSMLQFPL